MGDVLVKEAEASASELLLTVKGEAQLCKRGLSSQFPLSEALSLLGPFCWHQCSLLVPDSRSL